MPGSEYSVLFVVVFVVGQLSFKHIWFLAFSFFSSFLPTLEFERRGFGKLLYCLKSSYVSITNVVQVAKHRLATSRACCCLSEPNVYLAWKSGRQFAPSGAIPKKHAYVQGWILNASSQNQMISSQKMVGNGSLLRCTSWSQFLQSHVK